MFELKFFVHQPESNPFIYNQNQHLQIFDKDKDNNYSHKDSDKNNYNNDGNNTSSDNSINNSNKNSNSTKIQKKHEFSHTQIFLQLILLDGEYIDNKKFYVIMKNGTWDPYNR